MEHEGGVDEPCAPESQSLDSAVSAATEDSYLGTSSEASDTELLKEIMRVLRKKKPKYPKSWMRKSGKVKDKYRRKGGANLKGIICHNCLELGHFQRDCRTQERKITMADEPLEASPALVRKTLCDLFDQDTFFPGQEDTIMKILSGISTVSVLPMDCDKSTCYLLPAYLYSRRSQCVTLVISPQISLMNDQVQRFPSSVRGAYLNHTQTRTVQRDVLHKVIQGKTDVLLLTPESFESYKYWRFPPIAFVCIDDFHSISEWGHFFRHSFLRIPKVLQQLGIQRTLALSSTARKSSAYILANQLAISKENVIFKFRVPENLYISVSTTSHQGERDRELIDLVKVVKKNGYDSVKIYCCSIKGMTYIHDLLKEEDEYHPNEAKKQKIAADCYSGSVSPGKRDAIQYFFKSGDVSNVITTVASGIGLRASRQNQAIIHYDMPKSNELFLHATGQSTYCHVFIDKTNADADFLTGLIKKDVPKQSMIKDLVDHIADCKAKSPQIQGDASGSCCFEVLSSAVQFPKPAFPTLVCYLEMDGNLEMMAPIFQASSCKIVSAGFSTQKLQQICELLYQKCADHEARQCKKLEVFHRMLQLVAHDDPSHSFKKSDTSTLKQLICDYFNLDQDDETKSTAVAEANVRDISSPEVVPPESPPPAASIVLQSQLSSGTDVIQKASAASCNGAYNQPSDSSNGINEPSSASPITSGHGSPKTAQGRRLSTSDLASLLENLTPAAASWYNIGLQIGLDSNALDRIKGEFSDPLERMREVLKHWLKRSASTVSTLVQALNSKTVGENQLASGLEQIYCSVMDTENSPDYGEQSTPLPSQQCAANPPTLTTQAPVPRSESSNSNTSTTVTSTDEVPQARDRQTHLESESQQSSAKTSDICLDEKDLVEVSEYLHSLDRPQIYHLGIVLRCKQEKTKQHSQNLALDDIAFLDCVIGSWLRQEDSVAKDSIPTWYNLVKALRKERMGQVGIDIAEKIAKDQHITF